ncbi:hypothetical protein V8F06_012822 [Rhypophila decipiens]
MPILSIIPAVVVGTGGVIAGAAAKAACGAVRAVARARGKQVHKAQEHGDDCEGHGVFMAVHPQVTTNPLDICGVSDDYFDVCSHQIGHQVIRGVQITASTPSLGEARYDNVPPACIDLVVIMTNTCGGGGPSPQPCGPACIHYTDLSPEQLDFVLRSYQPLTNIKPHRHDD